VVLGSRSHQEVQTASYIAAHYANARLEAVGSQLKFPCIAEGLADAYPRFGTTMKLWDVAAGHALLLGAGGVVLRPDGSELDYHAPTLLAGDFIASSHKK
jgi:3'(2'), 5'-bisphosphate nucleotidase